VHTIGTPAVVAAITVPWPACVTTRRVCANTAAWGTKVSATTLGGRRNSSAVILCPKVSNTRTGSGATASAMRCNVGTWF
jgi:hypothetical protein